ncbi:MAG: ABC transporter substrate-binding protein [Mariprofundaceae bacterium]|nr:ABC transporter substrate-binding protein [Mariprofundaceae bacterium]
MYTMMKIMLLGLCMLAVPVLSVGSENHDGPKAVVEAAVGGIVKVLKERTSKGALTEKDRQAIRQQVTGRFDYREMARRSVGRSWKKHTAEQQAAFTAIFRDLLEYTYGNRLTAYKDQVIEYDAAEFRKSKARVKTRVIDAHKSTPVAYRLHHTPQGWMVYDIKIEGVSLVGTFRKDFKSSLKRHGFDALLEALRKKVLKMKAKDSDV